MVSAILILAIVLTILLGRKTIKEANEQDYDVFEGPAVWWLIGTVVSFFLFISMLTWCCSLIHTIGTGHTIDDKISMYQEENATIEENINTVVKNYMEYESKTFENLKDDDAINLVSLFPELKSDTLVSQQIEVYIANNEKIKELKEDKINLSKAKFNLYFGR